jgi:hypothetical protein
MTIPISITLDDIVASKEVIELASKRGAFTDPREYYAIGALYSKLTAYIAHHKEMQETAAKAVLAAEQINTPTSEGNDNGN